MAGKQPADLASQAGSMGARLEDEMNNDHLHKLQEIFEVRFESTQLRKKMHTSEIISS